jgi:hypothetical protein
LFVGASAKYPGERKGMLTKKREDKRKKERFTMHASLCGGGDLLKALGSVAHYLALAHSWCIRLAGPHDTFGSNIL